MCIRGLRVGARRRGNKAFLWWWAKLSVLFDIWIIRLRGRVSSTRARMHGPFSISTAPSNSILHASADARANNGPDQWVIPYPPRERGCTAGYNIAARKLIVSSTRARMHGNPMAYRNKVYSIPHANADARAWGFAYKSNIVYPPRERGCTAEVIKCDCHRSVSSTRARRHE